MNDYIIRAIAANDQIRAFAAVTTETVETARQDHNTSPVATASRQTARANWMLQVLSVQDL